jgi:SAM-dependent methyltransferase
MIKEKIKKFVRNRYAQIAKYAGACCAPVNSCCSIDSAEQISRKIGYTKEELESVPKDSNLGLGCGNPVALASLKKGEKVLDLGAGAGLDCFLAAQKVGEKGKVIGVDMTPEMIEKARENAEKGNYRNVEFRLGEIENLPIADSSIDVIISNCVINLSPNKAKVFKEAFRVLRPEGRIVISDIVLLKDLPDFIKNSNEAYASCVSGAIKKDEYIKLIEDAGFEQIEIKGETHFSVDFIFSIPTIKEGIKNLNISEEEIKEISNLVVSIKIQATKPKN